MSAEQRELEDREYDQLLRSYRSLPRSEPSARLDAAILGAARSAVARRPAQRKSRWPLGLATAATMILAAGAVLQLHKTRVMPAQQSTESAPALDAGAAQKKVQGPDTGLAPQPPSGAPATSNAAPSSKDRDLTARPADESEAVATGRLSDKHDLGAAAASGPARSSAPVHDAPAEPIVVPEIMQTEPAPMPVLAAPAPAPAAAPPPLAAPPASAAIAPPGATPELPRAQSAPAAAAVPSAAVTVPVDAAATSAAEPPDPAKPVAAPSAAMSTPAVRANAADELRDALPQPRRAEPAPTGASAGSLKKLEPMTVQGSRVKRVDTETAAPVFVIDPPAAAPASPAIEERKAAAAESAPKQAAAKEKSATGASDDRKQSQFEDDRHAQERQREDAAGKAAGLKREAAKTAPSAAADWLAEVRRLLAAGERERARAELQRLQSVYPQEKIPADLAAALQ